MSKDHESPKPVEVSPEELARLTKIIDSTEGVRPAVNDPRLKAPIKYELSDAEVAANQALLQSWEKTI